MNNEFFKKHSDKLFFVLALVFLSVALFRLAGSRTGTEKNTPSIIFTQWWENDLEKAALSSLIEEFESLHTGIKIILNTRSYEDLRRDLLNPAAVQENGIIPGDIIALDPLWIPDLLKREIIENANASLISSINLLYYNTDILRKAGFSRPPKTRGEFLNYARTVAKADFALTGSLSLGLNSSRGIYDDIFPWIWSAGTHLITDGKPVVTSKPVIDALSFLGSLNSEALITQGKMEDFISGKAAFVIAPARDIRMVRERLGDEAFGITSIPLPDDYAGKSFFAAAGWTVGVHSASVHKEIAGLFADFLAEKASFLSDEILKMPGNRTPPLQDEFYSKVWDIAIANESAQDFSGLPWMELEEIFKEELLSMFAGKLSPAETAAAIQNKWEIILGN